MSSRHRPLTSVRPHEPMYPYQVKGFNFVLYYGRCYLMLDMGMGKTRICIEVSRVIEYPMFVVAPKYVALETWPDELKKWDPSAKVAILHGANRERVWANSDAFTNIIITYDMLEWFTKAVAKRLRPLQKYFLVIDEGSWVKNHRAKRWEILRLMMPMMSPYVTILSGTPSPNSLEDLWAQYYLLDGGRALCPEYYQFRSRFFDYTGPNGNPPFQTTIKPGADKQIFELIKPITLRMDIEDYHDLPKVIHRTVKVALPKKLLKLYNDLWQDFMLEFPDLTVLAVNSAGRDHKLRQLLQGAVYGVDEEEWGSRHRAQRKVKFLHDVKARVIKEIVDSNVGQPVLIATQFRFEPAILSKVFKKKLPVVDGSTSAARGKKLLNQWNRRELRELVVQPKSIAFGTNLQTGGSDLVLAALPWELDVYLQLLRRLRRPGQTAKRVTVTSVAFRDTVDEKVAEYIKRKELTQEGLFDAMKK
jgi:SNF2 family DNA or RNA helicase